jgi:hypothetical protein
VVECRRLEAVSALACIRITDIDSLRGQVMKCSMISRPRRLLMVACAVVSLAAVVQAKPPASDADNAAADKGVVPLSLPEGIATAQQTATPMFVMLTRATCGNCNHLKGRIAQEQEVQDLLAKYVVVDIDVDGPVARQWQARFPSPGNTLPFVYLVSANGQGIHSTSGALQGETLPTMLKEGLTKAEEIHQAAGLLRKKKKRGADKPAKDAVAAADAKEDAAAEAPAEKPAKARPPRPAVKVDPLKQAASAMNLARAFAEKRPEKAQKYAEQVIELAPGTPLAAEAKKLLERLR